jgi:predicted dehydrogenase
MAATRTLRFAAIGLDHRHIYEMTSRLLEQGCECVGYWTQGEPQPLAGFIRRFPNIPRITEKSRLLEDPTVQLILTAAVNCDRAGIAMEAMRHGKDVMTDKPGCTTSQQLAELRHTVTETGADMVGQLLRAVRGARGDAGDRFGEGWCHWSRRPNGGNWAAPAQPTASASLVLPA